MELNLCATCGAFVNALWDKCAACGTVVTSDRIASAVESAPAEPEVDTSTEIEQTAMPKAPVEPDETESHLNDPPDLVLPPTDSVLIDAQLAQDLHSSQIPPSIEPFALDDSSEPHEEIPSFKRTDVSQKTSLEELDISDEDLNAPLVGAHFAPGPSLDFDSLNLAEPVIKPSFGKRGIIALAITGCFAIGAAGLVGFNTSFASKDSTEKSLAATGDDRSNDSTPPANSSDNTAGADESDPTSRPSIPDSLPRGNSNEWIDYAPHGALFSVKLPAEPSIMQFQIPGGTITYLGADTKDGKSEVTVGSMPTGMGPEVENNKNFLKDVLNAASASSRGEMKGQVFTTENGIVYLDATFSDEETTSNVRVFATKGHAFFLEVSTDGDTGDGESFNKLIKSFSFESKPNSLPNNMTKGSAV